MCSDTFDYDPADANTVNTLFWIAFMVGRLSGTFIAVKLPPWLFIIIDCVGSIIGKNLLHMVLESYQLRHGEVRHMMFQNSKCRICI